jgi:hypothetical protein
MKLWEVEIVATAVVWAKDQREAERIATPEVDDCSPDATASEISPAKPVIPGEWSDCEPFGDAPDGFEGLTVEQIRDKWKDPDSKVFVPDPYTLPLPGV